MNKLLGGWEDHYTPSYLNLHDIVTYSVRGKKLFTFFVNKQMMEEFPENPVNSKFGEGLEVNYYATRKALLVSSVVINELTNEPVTFRWSLSDVLTSLVKKNEWDSHPSKTIELER